MSIILNDSSFGAKSRGSPVETMMSANAMEEDPRAEDHTEKEIDEEEEEDEEEDEVC